MAERVTAIGHGDGLAFASAGYALARVCLEDDVGIAMLDRALSINQNLAVGWRYRGGIRVIVGRHEAGIEDLSRALRLNRLDPESYFAESVMAVAHIFTGSKRRGTGMGHPRAGTAARPYAGPMVLGDLQCALRGHRGSAALHAPDTPTTSGTADVHAQGLLPCASTRGL